MSMDKLDSLGRRIFWLGLASTCDTIPTNLMLQIRYMCSSCLFLFIR
uniref:Uncharacterized protein n=1 Tax=Rhizophora mucronata TaxID=61149 RepID=A0A2P2Q8Y6_RHIMU